MRNFVDGLMEQWINGHKLEVLEKLGRLHPLHAALACSYLYDVLGDYDKGVLGRLLQRQAPAFNEEEAIRGR